MTIKVKKLDPEAVLPKSANPADAGYDLVALDDGVVAKDGYIQYRTGIAIAPPEGYHTEIFPRSSISKYDLALANSIGLVDNGYRGEILVRFKPTIIMLDYRKDPAKIVRCYLNRLEDDELRIYKKGDRIAQLVVRKTENATFEWSEDLDQTVRGTGGFGSTSR